MSLTCRTVSSAAALGFTLGAWAARTGPRPHSCARRRADWEVGHARPAARAGRIDLDAAAVRGTGVKHYKNNSYLRNIGADMMSKTPIIRGKTAAAQAPSLGCADPTAPASVRPAARGLGSRSCQAAARAGRIDLDAAAVRGTGVRHYKNNSCLRNVGADMMPKTPIIRGKTAAAEALQPQCRPARSPFWAGGVILESFLASCPRGYCAISYCIDSAVRSRPGHGRRGEPPSRRNGQAHLGCAWPVRQPASEVGRRRHRSRLFAPRWHRRRCSARLAATCCPSSDE